MNGLCDMHLIICGSEVKATLRAQIKDKNGEDYFLETCNNCKELGELLVRVTLPLMEAENDSRK